MAFGASAGFAAPEGACRRYAADAVTAQQENARRGCGFAGPAWHGDYRVHFGWCLSQPFGTIERETYSRQSELSDCGGRRRGGGYGGGGYGGGPGYGPGPGGGDFCEAYARAAVEDQSINQRRGCGLGGPRFHGDYGAHYRWCRTVSRDHAFNEERARRATLRNQC
jgi:hypothetical protein